MISPGIVASGLLSWLKRTSNRISGWNSPGPLEGSAPFSVTDYGLDSSTLGIANDGTYIAGIAWGNADSDERVYVRCDMSTPGDTDTLSGTADHVSVLPNNSVYELFGYPGIRVFENDVFQTIGERKSDSKYFVLQIEASTATADIVELYELPVTTGYAYLNYSLDGLHAYVFGDDGVNDYRHYLLTDAYDWSSPTLIDNDALSIGLYVGDYVVSQDGEYVIKADIKSNEYNLDLETEKLTTPFNLSATTTPQDDIPNPRPLHSVNSLYWNSSVSMSLNGKWVVGKSDYDLLGTKIFVHQIEHYLDYADAAFPAVVLPVTETNITELNGTDAYYAFDSSLTATRIVMEVLPLAGNSGLPTGVPAVTDGEFQTLDFTLTGGSIQDIGRNGASYFMGYIREVHVFNGVSEIAYLKMDEDMTGASAVDSSGSGNDATAYNFEAHHTYAYSDETDHWLGPELITPTVFANPYLAQNQWAYDGGAGTWTLTGTGSRSLLEFYESTDQPGFFRIEANFTTLVNTLNFVNSAVDNEFANTAGTHVFLSNRDDVGRQTFHRRFGGENVTAVMDYCSFRAYLLKEEA